MNHDEKLLADYVKMNPLAGLTAAPPMVAAAVKRESEREESAIRERATLPGEQNSGHTPGPWRVTGEGEQTNGTNYFKVRGTVLGGKFKVANIPYLDSPDHERDRLEARANARLIAAAPELLGACDAALRYDEALQKRAVDGEVEIMATGGAVAMGDDLDALYSDWITKVSAAIAKAKG